MPDLTLVLDVPTDVARARVGTARDRIEDRPDELSTPASARASCRGGRGPIRPRSGSIDASGDPEAVARQIQDEVAHALALDPRP